MDYARQAKHNLRREGSFVRLNLSLMPFRNHPRSTIMIIAHQHLLQLVPPLGATIQPLYVLARMNIISASARTGTPPGNSQNLVR